MYSDVQITGKNKRKVHELQTEYFIGRTVEKEGEREGIDLFVSQVLESNNDGFSGSQFSNLVEDEKFPKKIYAGSRSKIMSQT